MKRLLTKTMASAAMTVLLITSLVSTTPAASVDSLMANTQISGFGYFMFGQIMSGEIGNTYTTEINHYWQNNTLVHLCATSNPNTWFTTKIGLEVQKSYPLKSASTEAWQSFYAQSKITIPVAEGIFHWNFVDKTVSSLKVECGAFPYTFNPEVKDLGNYLYRSQAHPLYIQNKLDYPWADLLGMHAELGMLENSLKVDAFFTSEQSYVPWFDWSPGVTVSYNLNKIVEVGAGVTFPHLVPAFGGWLPDKVGKAWKSTIVDTKLIFDPKPLLGDFSKMLGAKDGIIYGEVAILGLKDSAEYSYSDYNDSGLTNYLTIPKNNLLHRMPMLLGVNIPTFKFLDYLSVELEWWKSPYANEWLGDYQNQQPISISVSDSAQRYNYINGDNFKWSISAKKSIGKFEIKAMAANDHVIFPIYLVEKQYTEQTLKKGTDWQWYLELRL